MVVVVADCSGQNLLGFGLADDIAVKIVTDFARFEGELANHILIMKQTKDKSTHKGITTAYSINNICNIITTRFYQFLTIVKHTTPCVVVCIYGTTECYYHLLTTRKSLHHLLAYAQETALVNIAIGLGCIKVLWLDAKHFLAVLFITKNNVRTSHHLRHHLSSRLAILP